MDTWLQQQVEARLLNYNAQQATVRQRARAAVEAMRNQSEQNGQLIIIRNGNRYNALGQIVR